MEIRTLIVDDEPLARERVRRMLRNESDINIIGECSTGTEAVSTIKNLSPDLVFLDIQMPEMNGFEVLQAIVPKHIPSIIFVTAYDQYAIRAFDIHALDYLLKPINNRRFQTALLRVREDLKKNDGEKKNELFDALLTDLRSKRDYVDRLVLKSEGRVYFVKTCEIDWIEAYGNYIKIHCGKQKHLQRETMNGIEAKLDPTKFVRVHRSTIVNTERIKELFPLFNGDYTLILNDDTELVLSRNFRQRLLD